MYLTQGPLEHQHFHPAFYLNHLPVFQGLQVLQVVQVVQAALQAALLVVLRGVLPLLRLTFTLRLSHPLPLSHWEPFHLQPRFRKCWSF